MLVLLTQVIGTGSPRLQVSPFLHNQHQHSASVSNQGKHTHVVEVSEAGSLPKLPNFSYVCGGLFGMKSFFPVRFYCIKYVLQFSTGDILFLL